MSTEPTTQTAARRTRQRKSTEQRRAEIIGAVLDLSYEIGPDQITAETIARRLGFSQGALFRHFPTMSDLWHAVVADIRSRLEIAWAPAIETAPMTALERLETLVRRHLGVVQQTPGMAAIIASRELHVRNAELNRFFQASGDFFVDRLATIVDEGRTDRVIAPHVDSRAAARMTITMMMGLAIYWLLSGCSFDLPAAGVDQLHLLWAGLAAAQ